jgi:hypothetical protein
MFWQFSFCFQPSNHFKALKVSTLSAFKNEKKSFRRLIQIQDCSSAFFYISQRETFTAAICNTDVGEKREN